jgi:16S rRNA (cytosine1402-N4)-methyltransferase
MSEGDKRHIPVLLHETVEGLAITPDATVIDATLGSGGHFSAILEMLRNGGTLLGIDVDQTAVTNVQRSIQSRTAKALFATGNFRDIAKIAREQKITKADAIVADLGWRMEQFSGDKDAGGGKGFSFSADEPLEMTFGNPASYAFTATDIVNSWREEDIATILKGYGEERYARRIAHAIVERRESKNIGTAVELAEIIESAVPAQYRHGRIHPATKTFQALRIAVNDELDSLREFITSAVGLLSSRGRLAIISFHSIEDRIVKQTMRTCEDGGQVRRITKKPLIATDEERHINPRARSATLRIIEKI